MSKFIFGNPPETFLPLKNYREDEYLSWLIRFSTHLFPEWQMAEWDKLVEGPSGKTKLDAVLIRKDYTDWFVVEVELASHPRDHFETQFRAQRDATYCLGPIINSIVERCPDLDPQAIRDMIKRTPRPALLCIANQYTQILEEACRSFGYELSVISPWKNTKNKLALQVSRMPTALEASSMKASTKYNLQFIKNFGNQSVYSLPRTAPESECYTLASGGELYECFVYAAKANLRTIWIPKSIKVLHKKPYIYLIDPTTPSFRTD
jgi:hypothetical protein